MADVNLNYACFVACIMLLLFCGCENSIPKKQTSNSKHKFHNEGRFLVKETYDNIGKLQTKQFFNKDTMPDGAMIKYYPDGKISSWKWFSPEEKKPVCGIFYYQNSLIDTLRGDPLIDAIKYSNGRVNLEYINPPQLSYIVKYYDFYEGKLINEKEFDPFKTDTGSWVTLPNYKFKKNHEYRVSFCIVDTIQNIIIQKYTKPIILSDDSTKKG